jgi:hypothetical protein
MSELLLDAAGRRRSPATLPEFHAGRPPRNKGIRYPADPPTVEEIIAVMRTAGDAVHGRRLRGLIVVLWRAGLRIHEALALTEADLDPRRGSLLVRRGKGGRRREVGMDAWAWEHLQRWHEVRVDLPIGPLFCVINGPTRGRSWSAAAARAEMRRTAATARVRRRFAPHQLRHGHAVEMAHEGVPLIVIQRQLGHSNLGITSIYLQGIDNAEIIETVHARRRTDGPRQRLAASLTLAASRSSREAAAAPTDNEMQSWIQTCRRLDSSLRSLSRRSSASVARQNSKRYLRRRSKSAPWRRKGGAVARDRDEDVACVAAQPPTLMGHESRTHCRTDRAGSLPGLATRPEVDNPRRQRVRIAQREGKGDGSLVVHSTRMRKGR